MSLADANHNVVFISVVQELHRASSIPFEDMIFFDNERRNFSNVRKLGVHCVHTPDGMTDVLFTGALEDYAAAKVKADVLREDHP